MKKLAIFITLSISTVSSFTQWELQNPLPTDVLLNDIHFTDSVNGWAVGENGTILNSSDGGETWILQYSENDTLLLNITTSFKKVSFADLNYGWVIGWSSIPYGGVYGIIYRTIDGGVNWESIYANLLEGFADVWFINPDTGWVAGADIYGKIIYKTTDGGNSWTKQYNDSTSFLSSLCFANDTTGWASGGEGTILYTSDGGDNWNHQIFGDSVNFNSISFTDELNGWVMGDMDSWPPAGKILMTNNGGSTWDLNYSFGDYEAHGLGSIHFTDQNNGWLTYGLPYSTWSIMRTTNSGENWNTQHPSVYTNNLPTLCFNDSVTGWVVAENMILNTLDGGENWTHQNSVSNTALIKACFIDSKLGWALGNRRVHGIMVWSNTILHTIDGGNNWQSSYLGHPNEKINDFDFIDSIHGWAVGGNMVKTAGGEIYKTIDGGKNMTLLVED